MFETSATALCGTTGIHIPPETSAWGCCGSRSCSFFGLGEDGIEGIVHGPAGGDDHQQDG